MIGERWRALMFTFSLVLIGAGEVRAQDLNLEDPAVPVIHKSTHSSAVKFGSGESEANMASLAKAGIKVPESVLQAMRYRGVQYDQFVLDLPNGVGTHDVLPMCAESRVRKSEVLADSEDLQWFDLLFYAYRDPKQAAQAEAWDRPTAPYLEGDLYNPYRIGDRQQEFGRLFQVECLPTRFHFVTIQGQRYLEYREGERAWDRFTESSGG